MEKRNFFYTYKLVIIIHNIFSSNDDVSSWLAPITSCQWDFGWLEHILELELWPTFLFWRVTLVKYWHRVGQLFEIWVIQYIYNIFIYFISHTNWPRVEHHFIVYTHNYNKYNIISRMIRVSCYKNNIEIKLQIYINIHHYCKMKFDRPVYVL